jgi:hypothetical protein
MDPISAKKLRKGDGTFESKKCILGFKFDGTDKMIWLEKEKQAALLTILHQWLREATKSRRGIPFAKFESVTAKLRHAFTALPEGRGLLSPCNWMLKCRPPVVFLHRDWCTYGSNQGHLNDITGNDCATNSLQRSCGGMA